MNFWFCEMCGKRLTEKDLEAGAARNKKLKGIFCHPCSIGVMTMEMEAINVEEIPQTKTPSSAISKPFGLKVSATTATAAKVHDTPSNRLPSQRHTVNLVQRGNQTLPILIGAAGIVLVVTLLPMLASRKHPDITVRSNGPGNPINPPVSVAVKEVPRVTIPASISTEPVQHKTAPEERPLREGKSDSAQQPFPLKDETSSPAPTKDLSPAQTQTAAEPQNTVKVVDGAGETQFAGILKELRSMLRQNQFSEATRFLDEKLRDGALAGISDRLTKEKADIAEIQALRLKAVESLRAKTGSIVTLKKGTMTGCVKADSKKDDVTLVIKDGPEFKISAGQLDVEDVCNLVPFDNGTDKAEDLRRRGLLFLAAGEIARAEEYFIKSRESGLSEPVTRYLDRITLQKSEERELAAMAAWKKAEEFYENRSWDSAKHAYELLQREYAGSAVVAANLEVLKNHMDAVVDQRAFYLCDMAETEVRVGHGKFGKKGDLGYLKGKIEVVGKFSLHGLSMHPSAKSSAHVAYILNKAFGEFRSTVALNDDAATCGSPLIFKVRGDGKELWVSKPITTSRAPQDVVIDLNGVTKLELEIQCNGDDSFAHGVWVEPRVEKN